MKKILFLGAANFQMPPIIYAKEKGYYTITCDNRPENPGHKVSDEAYIISTIDKEAVLSLAKLRNIDGILTYGSDVSAPTVAYVCSNLGLPGNPIKAIETLTNKGKFRDFLNSSGIQKIEYKIFKETAKKDALEYALNCKLPMMVKPVDAAGSKGVSVLSKHTDVLRIINYAFDESFSKTIIIEEYFCKSGKQVCGDGFFDNGKIQHIFFGDGHFYDDGLHLAPWGETFPSTHNPAHLAKARWKIEKILNMVGFVKGAFNFDVLIDERGESFVIEIGPRNGGNYIPTIIDLKYGIDMIAGSVESAINRDFLLNDVIDESCYFYAGYMMHTKSQYGKFIAYHINDNLKSKIYKINEYLDVNNNVYPFIKANNAIANVILKFHSFYEMLNMFENINDYVNICVQEE